MNRIPVINFVVIIAIIAGCVLTPRMAMAASTDMESTRRTKYVDGSTESLREVQLRRDEEMKEYRQKVIAHGEESVQLLKEIRDLLVELNEKE